MEESRDPDVGLSDPEEGVAIVSEPEVPEKASDSEEPPPVEPPPVVLLPPPVDTPAVGRSVGLWSAKNEILSPVLSGNDA
jgi:hypothetical protein